MDDIRQRIHFYGVEEVTIRKELFNIDGVKKENAVLRFKGGNKTVEIELTGNPRMPLKITRQKNVDFREKVKK